MAVPRIAIIDSGGASQTLTEKIWVTPTVGASSYHTGSVDGWFDYLPYTQNFESILGYYRSSGDDVVTIQLEIEGDGVVDSQIVHQGQVISSRGVINHAAAVILATCLPPFRSATRGCPSDPAHPRHQPHVRDRRS